MAWPSVCVARIKREIPIPPERVRRSTIERHVPWKAGPIVGFAIP
jgi:hypothetical protein